MGVNNTVAEPRHVLGVVMTGCYVLSCCCSKQKPSVKIDNDPIKEFMSYVIQGHSDKMPSGQNFMSNILDICGMLVTDATPTWLKQFEKENHRLHITVTNYMLQEPGSMCFAMKNIPNLEGYMSLGVQLTISQIKIGLGLECNPREHGSIPPLIQVQGKIRQSNATMAGSTNAE